MEGWTDGGLELPLHFYRWWNDDLAHVRNRLVYIIRKRCRCYATT